MITDYTHALSTDVLSLSSQLLQKYRMKILSSYKSRDPQTPGAVSEGGWEAGFSLHE